MGNESLSVTDLNVNTAFKVAYTETQMTSSRTEKAIYTRPTLIQRSPLQASICNDLPPKRHQYHNATNCGIKYIRIQFLQLQLPERSSQARSRLRHARPEDPEARLLDVQRLQTLLHHNSQDLFQLESQLLQRYAANSSKSNGAGTDSDVDAET